MTTGMKTSEMWIGLLLPLVVSILNKIFGIGLDDIEVASMFAGGGAYALSRGNAKAGGSKK